MIRQLKENVSRDGELAQKELDTFTFHHTQIAALSEKLQQLEQRKSELSCDRAAAYITGPDATASMLARLAGGPKSITSQLNMEELARQADQYDALCKDGMWNKALQTFAVCDKDHPFVAVRMREMLNWTATQDFRHLLESHHVCPNCGKEVDEHWHFCQNCGTPLK